MRDVVRRFILRALLIEGSLIPVALIWAYFRKMTWQPLFSPVFPYCWIGIGAGLLLIGVNYAILEYGAPRWSFFRQIKRLMDVEVTPFFRTLPLPGIAALAVCSGIAEEMLFRGVLQAQVGLFAASLLFGAAHVWRKDALPYGVYAAVTGVYLGGLYAITHSLWAPILAHGINNFVAIWYCRRSPDIKVEQAIVPEQSEL